MIKKIVLTGGPCAGKSTSISKIKRKFEEEGFIVLVVNETATELINMGIRPFGENKIDMYEFQRYVFAYQLNKEKLIDRYISQNINKDILVLYDRSIIDNKSYVSKEEFKRLLTEFNMTEADIFNRYDMAIHLLTAAKDTNFYTLENNAARSESKEEAIIQDNKTLKCYLGFPHHIIIDNSTDFENKVNRVIEEISKSIRGKTTIIKQRKYLVSEVNNRFLEENARRLSIVQTYLNRYDRDVMVRKVKYDDSFSYYISIKTTLPDLSEKIVTERIITEKEYNDLVDMKNDFIRKDRFCFEKNNIVYRLDHFENDLMLLEVEGYNNEIKLPNELKVEMDVTNDPNYSNKVLAHHMNKSLHMVPIYRPVDNKKGEN